MVEIEVDLVDLVQSLGVQIRKSGSSWSCCCPLHGGDNPTGFSIYESGGKQYWHCFTGSCGGGDIIDFIKIHDNVDFKEAYKRLGGDLDPARMHEVATKRIERKKIEEEKQAKILAKTRGDILEAQSWIKYHENMTENFRGLWRNRGIPDSWQNYFYLGACESFGYISSIDKKLHNSPSLTIPIFDNKREPLTIRHRLLKSLDPADKYRPEKRGLGAHPYIADTDIWMDFERALIVEGEVKAIVTYLTIDVKDLQVIGIPGKNKWRDLAKMINGRDVWVCFDPDANEQANEFSKVSGAKIINLPVKIDDAIVDETINRSAILSLMRTAKPV